MYVEVRDMTKIKIGDIVSHQFCGTIYGVVTRRIDIGGVDDIKGRYFCVLLLHNLYEVVFKIKELKLLTG